MQTLVRHRRFLVIAIVPVLVVISTIVISRLVSRDADNPKSSTHAGSVSGDPEAGLRPIRDVAGFTDAPVGGPMKFVSTTQQPQVDWIAVIQAPFPKLATVLVDWTDEDNFIQIRPRIGFGGWTVDRFVDGKAHALGSVDMDESLPITLVVRRVGNQLQVDFPRRVDVSVNVGAQPANSQIGIGWFGPVGEISLFDLGPIDLADQTKMPQPDKPANPSGSAFTIGPLDYTVTWRGDVDGVGHALLYAPKVPHSTPAPAAIVVPGYLGRWDTTTWYAAQLASRGYVVMALEIPDEGGGPDTRSHTIAKAVDLLREGTLAKQTIDPNKIVLMGHSMGGGGVLAASAADPKIAAVVALSPWVYDKSSFVAKSPTLMITCSRDSIAVFGEHGARIKEAIGQSKGFAWIDLGGLNHNCSTNHLTEVGVRHFFKAAILDFLASTIEHSEQAHTRFCRLLVTDKLVRNSQTDCSTANG